MGRKVNTAWFGQYRTAIQELETALEAGEHRAHVLTRQAVAAGIKEPSFARLMKAGRFLDSQIPALPLEAVRCSYVQVEILEKIFRIDPAQAQEKLSAVLVNCISALELEELFRELKKQHPVAEAIVGRDNIRQATTDHERKCTQAILATGPDFFQAPSGRILKQTKANLYTSPQFIVAQEDEVVAAIFVRVGGASKSALAVAFDMLQLALAHHTLISQIWFLFPESSPVPQELAALAFRLGAIPPSDQWLHIAILEEDTQTLQELTYQGQGRYLDLDLSVGSCIDSFLTWEGKDLKDLVSNASERFRYFDKLQKTTDDMLYPKK